MGVGVQSPKFSLKSLILSLQQETRDPYFFILYKTLPGWNSFVGPICYSNHIQMEEENIMFLDNFCQEVVPYFMNEESEAQGYIHLLEEQS